MKHGEIEKIVKIPGAEISRHLKRLLTLNLIEKSVENRYKISKFGKFVFSIVKQMEFAIKTEDIISTHDFPKIPLPIVSEMDELKSIEIGNKTMENIDILTNTLKNAEKTVWVIIEEFQESLFPVIQKKLQNTTIDIKAIIDTNLLKKMRDQIYGKKSSKIPQIFLDRKEFNAFESVRFLDPKDLDLSLLVSDKGSILFLKKDNEIDYKQSLYGIDESFINWTKTLFNWYWNKSKEIKNT